MAHTRLQTPIINETNPLSAHASTYNNMVIAHGCGDVAVKGVSIVFPDGTDSIISDAAIPISNPAARTPIVLDTDGDGSTTIDDIMDAYGNIAGGIQSDDVFNKTKLVEKTDPNSAGVNVVGVSQFGGQLPANIRGLVPLTTGRTVINPDACVASVTLEIWGADVCKVTTISGFSDATLGLWTPAVGSAYDGVGLHGYNSPPTLQILRVSALPAGCTTPKNVRVTPSAAQIDRDAPIKGPAGGQFWPD